MSITLYGIPNCDTVKKARKFLSTHEVEYHFHNYKTDGADLKTLQGWIDELGFTRLAPVLSPERLMPYAGRDDQFMRAEAVERFYGRWDGVDVRWLTGGHITALLPMPRILADVKRRLDAFRAAR